MRELLAVDVRRGVEMRVEHDEAHRTVGVPGQGARAGYRRRVVAADQDREARRRVDLVERGRGALEGRAALPATASTSPQSTIVRNPRS